MSHKYEIYRNISGSIVKWMEKKKIKQNNGKRRNFDELNLLKVKHEMQCRMDVEVWVFYSVFVCVNVGIFDAYFVHFIQNILWSLDSFSLFCVMCYESRI